MKAHLAENGFELRREVAVRIPPKVARFFFENHCFWVYAFTFVFSCFLIDILVSYIAYLGIRAPSYLADAEF